MAACFEFFIRVYIEDTDAGGIVYHANHIKYMERTRTEWLRSLTAEHYWSQPDYTLVVYALDLRYHKPIFMNNLIRVTATVTRVKAASFEVEQAIYRDNTLLAAGHVTVACVSKAMQAQPLPIELKQRLLEQLQA